MTLSLLRAVPSPPLPAVAWISKVLLGELFPLMLLVAFMLLALSGDGFCNPLTATTSRGLFIFLSDCVFS